MQSIGNIEGSDRTLADTFKLDLGRDERKLAHLGLDEITLNNDRQDPSHSHQCLAYGAFAAAGVPASRCGLAHVVVNGEDLGTYTPIFVISASAYLLALLVVHILTPKMEPVKI